MAGFFILLGFWTQKMIDAKPAIKILKKDAQVRQKIQTFEKEKKIYQEEKRLRNEPKRIAKQRRKLEEA